LVIAKPCGVKESSRFLSKKEFARTDGAPVIDLEIALSVVSAKVQPLELARLG
jgi:hypothetical protein